jgi:hypothetical protein
MLTGDTGLGYYDTQVARLMAGRTDIPFPATLMAARERNEPPSRGRSFARFGMT